MSGSVLAPKIKPHMAVVGSDGEHVGTVDAVEEDRIKLSKDDGPDKLSQHHHYLPVSGVAAVEGNEVRLNMEADRARKLATISTGSDTTHAMGSMGAAS